MKRTHMLAAVVGLALAAGSLTPISAAPKPQIEDPVGDSNFVNDQGTGDGSFGDFTGADAGTVSDLMGITFSNDKKNLLIQIDTEAAPPATTGIGYRVRTNPDGAGGTYCLLFELFYPGANNVLTTAKAHFIDACGDGEKVEIEVLGTQLVIPRNLHKSFGKGGKLTAPQAQAFLYSGDYPSGAIGPYADTTKVGTDYKLKK